MPGVRDGVAVTSTEKALREALGCRSGEEAPRRPTRCETAYVRFLALDVHRAEAGRLMLALEARFQSFARCEEPVGSPGAVGLARRRLRALYRTSRLRAPLEAARSRWDALARLCQRAREIAKRLGCFDVAREAGT